LAPGRGINIFHVEEIRKLITNNPNEYNETQKLLIYEKTGKQILTEVGLGKTDPKSLKLSVNQLKEINNLITQNPNEYNEIQKMLIVEKSGKDILRDVGNGVQNPLAVTLTDQQLNEIKKLVESNPQNYNEAQKSLLNQKKKE